ncbi:MAG: 1-deoxy-D-xylulose-5-phosphate synthase [Gammaproteobacteria bacterium]|nr:MAG: 1-deoxy-D-xylulose-5-phosphate synthase [Gammaproteobacteria bacterium]
MSLLESINSPADLRRLNQDDLVVLADELRQFLIDTVSGCGGHFGAGLGVVELTIALHFVFDTPKDRLIWDVGHQSYPHKVLTGRRDQLSAIRQRNGLAPFPTREESEYDTFGVGHSSTSISAALGMATAAAHDGKKRKVVAVIGDGAMTAGMAFEALNHAGDIKRDMIIVLNDNDMSISPNVGALSSYLTRILSGRIYTSVRQSGKKVLEHMPPVWEFARRAEEHMKGMIAPGTLFEELGINYYGPVDGHDLDSLVKTLINLREMEGPRLLHIITRKGKGYAPAEANPVQYHGVTPFDPALGMKKSSSAKALSYTQVFSDWLCDMAGLDERLMGITPAMREGSGLVSFSEQFPKRYFDVGIAEQHALTFAAGLACEGHKPVVAIYSSFLQRAYDQLIHDVCLQNLPVLLAIDRAGVVGADGPTHAGSFDLSFLRCLPNMVVMAPANEDECRQMLYTGFMLDQPAAVRYPRGTGIGVQPQKVMTALPLGKGQVCRRGRGVAILSFGPMLQPVLEATQDLDITVVNMRFIKPLDEALMLELAKTHELLVTIEDNVVAGGAGSAVAEYLAAHPTGAVIHLLGLPDRFLAHASRPEQLAECGLDAAHIRQFIQSIYPGGFAQSAVV